MKPLQCPACSSVSGVVSNGKRHTLYPTGCLFIAGLPLALLHQAAAPVDYECRDCGRKFRTRTLLARLWLGVIWVLLAWAIVALLFSE